MQDNRKREIRKQADSFRVKCKVGRYGIIDLFKECERLGYKLIRYPLGEDADLGFAIKKDADSVIFTNSCSRLSREIFTLAHEIGHAVLHLEYDNSFVDNNNTLNERNEDEKEREANYFAACLLMPDDDVDRFMDLEIQNLEENGLSAMDIARIMSEFSVSFDMALNRLESLEIIDGRQKIRLNTQKTENRVGNLLRSVGGNAKLNEPSQVIDMPYEYLDYGIYNYNHKAIPLETLNRILAYYELTIEDVRDKVVEFSDTEDDDLDKLIGGLPD